MTTATARGQVGMPRERTTVALMFGHGASRRTARATLMAYGGRGLRYPS